MPNEPRILWADDEIDLLRPHILLLQSKGYDVTSVTNGSDAVEQVKAGRFEVVFLDEQMPGMGGLETLGEIKRAAPEVPVVMVTKSEEEDLMEEALGGHISDYLTKPVNPSQILLTIKRLLERSRLQGEKASQDYLQAFSQITMALMNPLGYEEWVDVYLDLVRYDLQLEGDEGARQILADQFREANRAFGKFVEDEYRDWIADADDGRRGGRPVLSHEVLPAYVLPQLKDGRPVVFFLIDCMRHDQWLEFERLLYPLFDIEKEYYYSILPTATPYSRNAIFSGLLPRDLAKRFPDVWEGAEDDEHSRNRNEDEFLQDLLRRKRVEAADPLRQAHRLGRRARLRRQRQRLHPSRPLGRRRQLRRHPRPQPLGLGRPQGDRPGRAGLPRPDADVVRALLALPGLPGPRPRRLHRRRHHRPRRHPQPPRH